jgi:heat shock protein HslJ
MTAPTRFLAITALLGAMLVAAGCGDSATPTLTGDAWVWTSFSTAAPGSETVVPNPERYTIQFNDDGTFSAKVDCNQVGGTYTTGDGGAMTIAPGPSTLVACPADSLGDDFLQGLTGTTAYTIQDKQLALTRADGGTLTLDPQTSSATPS